MEISARLVDLSIMHPRLVWEDIGAAAVAVLSGASGRDPLSVELALHSVPRFGSGRLRILIDPAEVSKAHVARLRRTFEPSRLVELAGIAIAGLGLYHAGGHEIRDVALRGSAADYLVDDSNHLLELAAERPERRLGPTVATSFPE